MINRHKRERGRVGDKKYTERGAINCRNKQKFVQKVREKERK
jgi:hypothetical protein